MTDRTTTKNNPTVDGMEIGWGLIGASTIAREYMAGAIRRAGGNVRRVMGSDARHVEEFASDLDIPAFGTDLNELLNDTDVQAVYISSTNSKHCQQGLSAAAAGKHVLCDKPLATRSSDATKMVRACEDAGVVLAVNHHLRSSPIHRAMKRMITSGEVGEIRSMTMVHAGVLRPILQTWRIQDPKEGAIYLDLSVHDIDLASFLLEQQPLTATALGDAIALGTHDTHDHTMYALRMSGGTFVQVHESFVTPDVESQIIVYGTKGVLTAKGTLAQTAGGTLTRRINGKNEVIPLQGNDIYLDTVRYFVRSILGSASPRASGRDGLASLMGAEAVAKAALTGKTVTLKSAN